MSVEGLNSSPMAGVLEPPRPPAPVTLPPPPPVAPAATLRAPLRLWTAPAIGIVSFLFGFPAGIALAARNWHRLGMRTQAYAHVVAGVVVFAVGLSLPTNSVLFGLVNVGIAVYLVVRTRRDARALELGGTAYEPAGTLSGFATAIAGWCFTFAACVFIAAAIELMTGTTLS
jgi:hypothetical protein